MFYANQLRTVLLLEKNSETEGMQETTKQEENIFPSLFYDGLQQCETHKPIQLKRPFQWLLSRADWSIFHNNTEKTDNLPDPSKHESVEAFTQFLIQVAENSIPLSPPFLHHHLCLGHPKIKIAIK